MQKRLLGSLGLMADGAIVGFIGMKYAAVVRTHIRIALTCPLPDQFDIFDVNTSATVRDHSRLL